MRLRPRGIVLISVMFFVLMVGLFGRAMLRNGPSMARLADQAGHEILAQRAAEAGAAYARMQLRDNGDWKGNANTTTINQPDLKVLEDNGNVFGWLKGGAGEVSMFRIRFNFHDGATGGDELPNPASAHYINTTFLSLNNVRKTTDTKVPTVNPSTFRVDDPAVGELHAPRGSAFMRIEGWAGPALSDTTGPAQDPAKGALVSRVLRVVYTASSDPSIPDSALSAGNGIKTEMENGAKVEIIGAGQAKLRSKQGVEVTKWDTTESLLDMTGEVSRDPVKGIKAVTSSGVTTSDESLGDGNDFHNVTWDDVPLASTEETKAVQLPAGIYACDMTGVYRYYDMSAEEYKALAPEPSGFRPGGTVLSSNFKEVRSSTNVANVGGIDATDSSKGLKLLVTKDVNFNTSPNGNEDVVFTNLVGRKLHREDNDGKFEFSAASFFESPAALVATNSIISAKGDLAVLLNVTGENAALTTEGEAVVAAPSIALKKTSELVNQRLSVYAKGDLTVSTYVNTQGLPPYVPKYEGYGDLILEGLIYSWGDATIYSGTPGVKYSDEYKYNAAEGKYGLYPDYGTVKIQGALVAYGADPGAFNSSDPTTGPGTDGNGKISLHGLAANIIYDATKLVSDPSSLPESGLAAVARVSYGFEN